MIFVTFHIIFSCERMRTRENKEGGLGEELPSLFFEFAPRRSFRKIMDILEEDNLAKVNAFVGQEWVVLVCQQQEQRLFHHANTLVYSTQENKDCLVRLVESGAKDGESLAKLVQPFDDLVWMVEGKEGTVQLRTLGCMSMAVFFDNPDRAYERYNQGWMYQPDLWHAVRTAVLQEGVYQFGFAHKGKTGVLYNQDINLIHVPSAYRGGWFCSAQKKKEQLAKVYDVFLNRMNAGVGVEELVKKYVL